MLNKDSGNSHGETQPPSGQLTKEEFRRKFRAGLIAAWLIPPLTGIAGMTFLGFWDIYSGALSVVRFTGIYVLIATFVVFLIFKNLVIEQAVALGDTKNTANPLLIKRLKAFPWLFWGCLSIYSFLGAISVMASNAVFDGKEYTLGQYLFSMFGAIPFLLISAFPLFFYLTDLLGSYLGPKRILLMVSPLWLKVTVLGLFTPVMIDTILLIYYYNRTHYLEIETLILWFLLIIIAGLGTWFALRSFHHGMSALKKPLDNNYQTGKYAYPIANSLDEFGVLAAGWADLLQAHDNAIRLLKEREQDLSLTLDSIGDAVIVTDAHGNITRMNKIAASLTGWLSIEAVDKPLPEIFNIIDVESGEASTSPVEKVLSTGDIVALANHTALISKDGTEYQIADSAAPIIDEENKILGVILVFRDVTQQYQTEKALRRSQKMEAIGQLSGGIAHDFNNQLGIIIGYMDFLNEHLTNDARAKKWVDISTNATLRCMDLTRQLLSFSRTGSNKKTAVDINAQIRELETMFARSVTPAINIQYYLAEQIWLTEIDPGEFQDAILNLIINARDAMPDSGKLLIETENKRLDANYAAINVNAKEGDYIQLSLSDTGSGMGKETQERIFEPFYTTKAKGKGTGLGMSMVYGFVRRFGGFIQIYSELDVGTTIRLYLPRTSSTEVSSKLENITETELCGGNECILIVDDEEDLLHLADSYLCELGYQTFLACNASQALEILAKHNDIDLLFSDVVMPGGINGYELAQQAMVLKPDLKVLITSGFTSQTITQNVQASFSSQILSKPYRKVELARRIRLMLDAV